MEMYRSHVLVCAGAGCISSDCKTVQAAMLDNIDKYGLGQEVKLVETGCMGPCDLGPVLVVYPEGVFYRRVTPEGAARVVEEHLLKGRLVEDMVYRSNDQLMVPKIEEIEFFAKQRRIALRNTGQIDPGRIEEYITRQGYAALGKALTEYTPEQIIDEIKKSNLRGRGGGGFPTGLKWEFTAKAPGKPKYVVCNADEGDPGAFMDRSILEGDPHSVIEAMAIAGRAVDAAQGYIYVRAEYPLAVERLTQAIGQARKYGLLGKAIFGTDFDFDLEIRVGAGAFVCGEETALLASIEGLRGEPRPRPPFPASQGLFNKPTLLNNVETYANICPIILKGGKWYASIGTEKGTGTKVFALAGKISNTGLVEVPLGTSLGEIVYDIGGGIPQGKKFKAAQTGGPSGGCIPAAHLSVPVDYDTLAELGTIIGSGGLVVMDEDTCMVDLARYFIEFCQEESCGKCSPCRIGTKRMLEFLTRIAHGYGREGDIELLEDLGNQIKQSALCGLGQTAANPVLSTIRYFRDEYVAHIRDKKCPASVCASLFSSPCGNTCPAEVDVPIYIDLIRQGKLREAYLEVRRENPLAVVCGRVCNHPCETKCRREQLDEPIAIRSLKRMAGDWVMEHDGGLPVSGTRAKTGRKAAVIGSGPAGLTAAYYLAKAGHTVTVFEALDVPGGMLAAGIPAYRLPKDRLAAEIEAIRGMGVEFKTNCRLGRDITIEQLKAEGYEAVFLAIGAWQDQKLGLPGEDKEGVMQSLDFLRRSNTGRTPDVAGKRVAVVGGGNAAIDAARSSLRLGAAEVTIVYRRRQEDMPANRQEIADGVAEGVKVEPLVSPLAVLGNGQVEKLRLQRMDLGEFDAGGRRRPFPIEGATYDLPVDLLVSAVGQLVDDASLAGETVLDRGRGSRVLVDQLTNATNAQGVFAGGDCVTGPDTVIGAIAQGKRAAAAIDKYLGGAGEVVDESLYERQLSGPIVEEHLSREEMPMLAPAARCEGFAEVELGFDLKKALAEATRCLRCDVKEPL
ncbi:MAG: FAD-dependent oxidoreductase [Firmicutes bacterium]|nr:FAD-dependent oxidoreductase [Bacillota bacterium]